MDVVTLGAARALIRKAAPPGRNIGTRIFGGRMGNLNASSATTFHVALETAQHFDAVRIILANTSVITADNTVSMKVSVMSSAADLNNNAGTWVTALSRGGNLRMPTQPALRNGAISYTTTDWVSISSVPRTDGGTLPLVAVRVYLSGNPNLSVVGNGTDSFTNWASRPGRIHVMRHQAVDGANTPSNFTSTTNQSQSPIVGVQYLARGRVVTVGAVGDSITDGRGTYLGEGFVMPACEAISDPDNIAVEYANYGWSGQPMSQFAERALDIIDSPVRPDVLVLPSGSPNDSPGTITSSVIDGFRNLRSRVIAAAAAARVTPVVWTWLPVNTAQYAYGADDALRVADNAVVLATPRLIVADTATAVSGAVDAGQVQLAAGTTDDNIHPNDTGNALLAAALRPALVAAIGV